MTEPGTLQELRRGIAARGDMAAVIAYAGEHEEIWSFAQLLHVSACLAAGLARRGIARGDCVALIAPNSLHWLGAFWGIVAVGAVAVPLDPQTNERDLARMLKIAACRLAFTSTSVAVRLRSAAPSCQTILLDGDGAFGEAETWQTLMAPPANFSEAAAEDIAVIVFTSGTTGKPKAVPLTHANLLTNIRALEATKLVGPGDRALLPLPLYHAYPLTISMVALALACGIVLPAGVSGPELIAAIRRGEVTALVAVPRLYAALLDNVRRGIAAQPWLVARLSGAMLAVARWAWWHGAKWLGRLLFRSARRKVAPRLRLLVSGGAAMNPEVEEMLDAMGWEVLTGYGLVEGASMLTFNPPGAALPGSAGRPVPGTALRIARPDADGVGEIEARGPSLFAGYLGDQEKTRSVFTEDGWFRTGDLGSLDPNGYVHIVARGSETIVLADGKKLFPEEFETRYAAAPMVREVALLGVDGALVALVVPDLTAARDVGALRLSDALRDALTGVANTLPGYARPSGFAIAHEGLPRTHLGKLQRHLLPMIYDAARRPETAAHTATLSAEDHSLLETPAAAAVWRWLAKRFPSRSLRLDTVPQLDLGIDSLGWVEMTLALERDLGVALKESEIARIVTLRDLLYEVLASHEGEIGAASPAVEAPWLAPLGLGAGLFRALGEPLIRFVMRWAFCLRVEGLNHLPRSGPVLICPNHVSYLDPFLLAAALPRKHLDKTYWGGWTGIVSSTPLRRLFSRAARAIPVDPDRAVASGLAMGGVVLTRGWNLVWFPEGARSLNGKLQRFLPGIGALIEKRAVPVLPVYIKGSFEAWPATRRFPRLCNVTIRFGQPIDPVPLLAEPARRAREEKIAAAVQDAVAALAD